MFKKILVATDILDACDAAVSTGVEIAKQNNSKLYILHVLESSYSGKYRQFVKHFQTGEEIVSSDEYEKKVKEELAKSCHQVLKSLDSYDIRVTLGFPWEQILRLARKERVNLVILGPHSQRAEAKGVVRVAGIIGSTVEGVVMHEKCPIMIVNVAFPKERLKFRNIMICIDFSKSCESALDLAIRLGQIYGSKLFAFHMLMAPASLKYPQNELDYELAVSTKKLKSFCKAIPTELDYTCTVWEGTLPHLEILKFAREKEVDFIVMGSHAKAREDRWYVGSAVEQVSSRSMCPVCVVTDPSVVLKIDA